MQHRLVVLLIVAFVAPALAGCLGGEDAPAPGGDGCGAQCDPDAAIEEGKGGIRGRVLDDAFTAIAGANVTLRELELQTKTDDNGKYAFNNLAPGTYTIFAQNLPTHLSSGKQVEVVEGDPVQADIQLEILPPPAQPYSIDLEFIGVIGCAISNRPITTKDWCGGSPIAQGVPAPKLNQDAQTTFDFDMDKGISAIAIKLDSDPGPTGKAQLQMTWQVPVDLIQPIAGPTPVVSLQEFDPSLEQVKSVYAADVEGSTPAKFEIRADPDASQPQIAYSQKFSVWFTIFYNGEPVPSGYEAGPE